MSEKKLTVFRGALVQKPDLIALFKFLDEHTPKKYLNQPYFDPKSPLYGIKTPYKGYRPVVHGAIDLACKTFTFKGKPVSRNTIYSRIVSFPNGVSDESKPTQAGAKPVAYTKWEQTPTHKLIMEEIGADPNSVKANLRDPSRYKVTYNKRYRHDYTCYLAWKAMGAKIDLLNASLEQWLIVWGKDPKAPNMCHPSLRDNQTGLISYSHTTPLRWIMKRSNDPQVKNLIIINDKKFNTTSLKRTAGQHKQSYFTEQQCRMLPQGIPSVDTLGFLYLGMVFGGRSIALLDLTPKAFDFVAGTIDMWESKIQKTVTKPMFAHEASFIHQYIVTMKIGINEPLFKRTARDYNIEISALKQFFANTDHPLHWTPTTHTACKHTCVTQMSLHGVRMDTISDYIGTDPNTLKQFYRGGSEANIKREIGGFSIKQEEPTWRAFVIELTKQFAQRFEELTGVPVEFKTKGA